MVQMLPSLSITVAARSNVEIALNLIQIQTTIDTTTIRLGAPKPRGLRPTSLLAPHSNNIMNMFLAKPLLMPPRACNNTSLAIPSQSMHTFRINPMAPIRRVFLEARGGEDAVAGGVLDVDVEVLALHLDDDVEVDLHAVADALLDGERVRLLAVPPAPQLRPQQDARDDRHDDGPLAAARRARYILRFRLRYTVATTLLVSFLRVHTETIREVGR